MIKKKVTDNEKLSLDQLINPTLNKNDLDNQDIISLIATNELINSKNNKRISRLNPEQVNIITKLYLFGSVFNIGFVNKLANNILDLQISIRGLGRKELVQLVQRREMSVDEMSPKIKDIFR